MMCGASLVMIPSCAVLFLRGQGQTTFKGQQLHSRDLRTVADVANKRVVVVGGSKTAFDCLSDMALSKAAKSVTLVYRKVRYCTARRQFWGSVKFDMLLLLSLGCHVSHSSRTSYLHDASRKPSPIRGHRPPHLLFLGPQLTMPIMC